MNNFSSLVDILIKDEMNGIPRHEQVLLLGETPSYLVDHAGFPQLKMAIKGSVIGKACFDHGIPTTFLKRLPSVITSPRCLFKSAHPTHTDSVVVLTLEYHREYPIVIPLRMNQQIGRGNSYNLVSSIYGKEGPDPEVKWKASGLLIKEY